MSRVKTLQSLFKRYRRPGDLVFAVVMFVFAVFLLSQLGEQAAHKPRGKLASQPWFWPAISLSGMTLFGALHLIGSAASERIEGRWREVLHWILSVEYALWFIGYAVLVPWAGYLPATVLMAVALVLRAGYRSRNMIAAAVLSAVSIVVLFKTFLQVKLPAGRIYETLPDGLRQIMLTYF